MVEIKELFFVVLIAMYSYGDLSYETRAPSVRFGDVFEF
jgi:hypothetical protein